MSDTVRAEIDDVLFTPFSDGLRMPQGACSPSPAVADTAESRPHSLLRNFSCTAAGNVVYAACQWGMLIVLAKLGTPELLGQLALGLAVTAPVLLFTNMQLAGVLATDARRTVPFGDYLALRMVTTVAAVVAIAGVVALVRYPRQTVLVIMLLGFTKAIDAISDAFFGLFQQRERMSHIAVGAAINGIVSLLAFSIALWGTGSLVWALGGSLAGSAVALGIHNLPTGLRLLAADRARGIEHGQSLMAGVSIVRMLALARLAAPLSFAAVFVSLNANVPRYFLEHDHGTRALGLYAALSYAIVAGTTIVNALGQSAVPRLARHWANDERAPFFALVWRLVGIGALIGSIGVAIAVTAGGPLLRLLYNDTYAQHQDVFVWLMVAAGISYVGTFLGYSANATRAFDRLVLPLAGVTGVSIVASLVLVPRYGMMGAAWAVVLTNLAGCAVPLAVFPRRTLHLRTAVSEAD